MDCPDLLSSFVNPSGNFAAASREGAKGTSGLRSGELAMADDASIAVARPRCVQPRRPARRRNMYDRAKGGAVTDDRSAEVAGKFRL